MPDKTTATGSQLVTVRLDSGVRSQFDALAASSERTLAQLLRFAVSSYLKTSPAAAPTPSSPTSPSPAGLTQPATEPATYRHTSVRLDAATAATITARAGATGTTASDILRAAAAWWITTADPAALGAPAASLTFGEVPDGR
jgi:hypothetical protein